MFRFCFARLGRRASATPSRLFSRPPVDGTRLAPVRPFMASKKSGSPSPRPSLPMSQLTASKKLSRAPRAWMRPKTPATVNRHCLRRRETPTVGHGIRRLSPAPRAGNLSGLATCNAERSSTGTGFAGIANLPAAFYLALLWSGRAFFGVTKCRPPVRPARAMVSETSPQ